MKRIDAPEILDSDACSVEDVRISMMDLGRVNRWFGGVTTTQTLIERVARTSGQKHLSILEVAAGSGEVPRIVRPRLARHGIDLEFTLLDLAPAHLHRGNRSVVGDGLALPFRNESFDLVSCNLFAHHLSPALVGQFVKEALRVSRLAVLINDLVRHPLHLALVYAAFPIMRSRVAWLDGITSVRRAYVPEEMRDAILSSDFSNGIPRIEISRHYLFRMGVIVWKAEKAA
ncbi:MAG: methyltransferase domain-containing protein [Candidatus Sulfotelmatobacter sp.]